MLHTGQESQDLIRSRPGYPEDLPDRSDLQDLEDLLRPGDPEDLRGLPDLQEDQSQN